MIFFPYPLHSTRFNSEMMQDRAIVAIEGYTQAFEWYQFEWPPVTYNPDFKVTIIQRQITWKWYNIELHLQCPTNRRSYMVYRTAPFSMTLNDPLPPVSRSRLFVGEYLRNDTRYRLFQWNTNRDLHMPYSTVSFGMTLSELERLTKIFSDTKDRAVSLRQLSFLFNYWKHEVIFAHQNVICESKRKTTSLRKTDPKSAMIQCSSAQRCGIYCTCRHTTVLMCCFKWKSQALQGSHIVWT